MYRILDLDNCIADDERRVPLIDWNEQDPTARYAAYHADCALDPFVNRHLVTEADDCGQEIIILTGRPVAVRPQTEGWLALHRVRFKHMIMRNNNDTRPSVELKQSMLSSLWGFYDVMFNEVDIAFDDHKPIVDMYVRQGIRAVQVKLHSLSAYRHPLTGVVQ